MKALTIIIDFIVSAFIKTTLGIQYVKRTLQDEAFRILYPHENTAAEERLTGLIEQLRLTGVISLLKDHLLKENLGVDIDISPISVFSFYKKLHCKKEILNCQNR